MQKTFKIVLAFMFTLFTLPISSPAFAETDNYDNIQDGTYEITAKALHADKDEESGAAGFIDEDALITIKDGKIEFTVTLPSMDGASITGLQVEDIEPTVKETDDGQELTYELMSLNSELNAQVQYEVPAIGLDHDVSFRFILEGLDDLPVVEEDESNDTEKPESPVDEDDTGTPVDEEESNDTEEPEAPVDEEDEDETEEPETPANEEKPVNNEKPANNAESGNVNKDNEKEPKGGLMPDKAYKVDYVIKHESEDKASVADNFFEKPGILLEKDGVKYLQVTVTSSSMIDNLSTQSGSALKVDVDGKSDTETVQFKVQNDLSKATNLDMHVTVPGMYSEDHSTRVFLDQSSMEKVNTKDYELVAGSKKNANGPVVAGQKPGDPAGGEKGKKVEDNQGGAKSGDPSDNTGKKQVKTSDDALTPDKAYKIDYTIKHETEDKVSVADDFFEKPGMLLEKDEVKYLQASVTSSSMIERLETEFGPALIVDQDKSGGTMKVQFKVHDDLSKANVLSMHVNVPGLYNEDHIARLFLDESSMEEVDPEDYQLVAGDKDNMNGPLGGDPVSSLAGDGEKKDNDSVSENVRDNDDSTPNKPEFGDNEDSANGVGQGENPKTGDTSGLLFYTLLLIGSLIPLGFKLRNRLI